MSVKQQEVIICLFVGEILYRYRAGIPWRDLHVGFGTGKMPIDDYITAAKAV